MARSGGHERSRSATGMAHPIDFNFSLKRDSAFSSSRSQIFL